MKKVFDKIFAASKYDTKSLEQKALKLAEESGEVAQAVLSYCKAPGCAAKGKTKADVIEEACDCIITAASVIYQIENGKVDDDFLEKMIDHKLDKWVKKFK
ncbi:MAG: MazG-like family protein [Nitrosarchaeum sp.]|nr:MazG-like family protein [Nitrosarchaeum sp.]